jgi:hypothetical protein
MMKEIVGQGLADFIRAAHAFNETPAKYLQAAREKLLFTYNVDRDEVEDGDADKISWGEDGAFVPMWIWVGRREVEEEE